MDRIVVLEYQRLPITPDVYDRPSIARRSAPMKLCEQAAIGDSGASEPLKKTPVGKLAEPAQKRAACAMSGGWDNLTLCGTVRKAMRELGGAGLVFHHLEHGVVICSCTEHQFAINYLQRPTPYDHAPPLLWSRLFDDERLLAWLDAQNGEPAVSRHMPTRLQEWVDGFASALWRCPKVTVAAGGQYASVGFDAALALRNPFPYMVLVRSSNYELLLEELIWRQAPLPLPRDKGALVSFVGQYRRKYLDAHSDRHHPAERIDDEMRRKYEAEVLAHEVRIG